MISPNPGLGKCPEAIRASELSIKAIRDDLVSADKFLSMSPIMKAFSSEEVECSV